VDTAIYAQEECAVKREKRDRDRVDFFTDFIEFHRINERTRV